MNVRPTYRTFSMRLSADRLLKLWQSHMSQDGHINETDTDKYLTSDEVDLKIKRHITENVEHIKGKTIIDVGCNTGYYMLQFYLHGAKEVIGVEPRANIVDLFNEFAKQHDIPCKMIQGFHPKVFEVDGVDVVSMMSFDEEIPDFDDFLYRIGCALPNAILLIQTTMIDASVDFAFPGSQGKNVGKRFKGLVYKFESDNSMHRNGIDNRSQMDSHGRQSDATYIHSMYSKQYMEYTIDRNGFDIVQIKNMDQELKYPMTKSAKSGNLWWITAKNRSEHTKEPINLFGYNTK
jgi:SAM-dependent methyltransferase